MLQQKINRFFVYHQYFINNSIDVVNNSIDVIKKSIDVVKNSIDVVNNSIDANISQFSLQSKG